MRTQERKSSGTGAKTSQLGEALAVEAVEHPGAQQSHSLDSAAVDMQSASPEGALDQDQESAQDIYRQPRSKGKGGDSVLGGKCYAYATMNALDQAGKAPAGAGGERMEQGEVDDWIRNNEASSMGGGPGTVARKLAQQGLAEKHVFQRITKRGKYGEAIKTALSHKLPVTIGIDKPAKHWIHATNATSKNIEATDQQNMKRGTISLTHSGGKWTGYGESGPQTTKTMYQISDVQIGYASTDDKTKYLDKYL